jgi:hypothetical protein
MKNRRRHAQLLEIGGAFMTVKQLHRNWLWTTLFAIAAFAVLAVLDTGLKASTGFGTADLQKVNTAAGIEEIRAHWFSSANALTAGFSLGFDYLFMPLWGFAFYFSGIIVRERFAPKAGLARRAMALIAVVPMAGALFDVAENSLEAKMLISGATDQLANLAFTATTAKWGCFIVGALLLLGALVARMTGRKAAQTAD